MQLKRHPIYLYIWLRTYFVRNLFILLKRAIRKKEARQWLPQRANPQRHIGRDSFERNNRRNKKHKHSQHDGGQII